MAHQHIAVWPLKMHQVVLPIGGICFNQPCNLFLYLGDGIEFPEEFSIVLRTVNPVELGVAAWKNLRRSRNEHLNIEDPTGIDLCFRVFLSERTHDDLVDNGAVGLVVVATILAAGRTTVRVVRRSRVELCLLFSFQHLQIILLET